MESGALNVICQINKNDTSRPGPPGHKSVSDIRRSRRRCGMDAPSSANTSPSHIASAAPATHPRIACGPCMAATTSGSVMNGPTPIMSSMFSETALDRPMPRISLCWLGRSVCGSLGRRGTRRCDCRVSRGIAESSEAHACADARARDSIRVGAHGASGSSRVQSAPPAVSPSTWR